MMMRATMKSILLQLLNTELQAYYICILAEPSILLMQHDWAEERMLKRHIYFVENSLAHEI